MVEKLWKRRQEVVGSWRVRMVERKGSCWLVIEDKWRMVGKWCCSGCGVVGKGAISLAVCIARFGWAVNEVGMLY